MKFAVMEFRIYFFETILLQAICIPRPMRAVEKTHSLRYWPERSCWDVTLLSIRDYQKKRPTNAHELSMLELS